MSDGKTGGKTTLADGLARLVYAADLAIHDLQTIVTLCDDSCVESLAKTARTRLEAALEVGRARREWEGTMPTAGAAAGTGPGGEGSAWRAERRRAIRRACLREVGRGARWAAAGCAAIAAGLLYAWLCTRVSMAGL